MKTQMMPHFDSWLEFAEAIYAPNTLKYYCQVLKRFWTFQDGSKVTSQSISKYLQSLADRGQRNTTIEYAHKVLNVFYKWCHEGELIANNPVPKRKPASTTPPKEKPIYTRAEMDRLRYQAWYRYPTRPHWPDAILVAWHTGCRVSDVINLKWESVDLEARTITIIPEKTKQFAKSVVIPIAPELHEALVKRRGSASTSPYVLHDMHYRHIAEPGEYYQEFREICSLAGVRFHSIHGFRRSFVSRMANSNIPTEVICSITGHTLKGIQPYLVINMKSKQSAMAAIQEAEAV